MLLQEKFYKVINTNKIDDQNAVYTCSLLDDCDVYRGHFPGKPVSPGVCNIEMIKECAMMLTDHSLVIKGIKQCRLTAVASPSVCPVVDVTVNATPIEGGYNVSARIADVNQTYMEYKGEMTV